MAGTSIAEKNEGKEHKKNWSIMVFLAGGKDISEEARESMLRMKQVGSTDNIHVVAQFDSGGEGTSTKRYYLSPFDDALWIETLLTQASAEVSATGSSAAGKYYCQLLREALLPKDLSGDLRARLGAKLQLETMIELLKYSTGQFKRLVLNCVLDRDICPGSEGSLGNTNAGDPKVLVEFVRWAKNKYYADHHMVIFWGHGNGLSVAWDYPASPFLDPKEGLALSGVSEELKKMRGNGYKVDIAGFNSCSLGTIEVYHQLKGLVRYGIASEGFTPKTSWPYDKILKALDEELKKQKKQKPKDQAADVDPKDFASIIVDKYISYYKASVKTAEEIQKMERRMKSLGASLDMNNRWGPYNAGPDLIKVGPDLIKAGPDLIKVGPDLIKTGPDLGPQGQTRRGGIDLSVCELNKSIQVAQRMKILIRRLSPHLELLTQGFKKGGNDQKMIAARNVFGAILGAHAVSQSYFNKDYTDLYDFCRALLFFCPLKDIRTACVDVMHAISAMRTKVGHVGDAVQNSNGVSIFFPWSEWGEDDVIARYEKLTFIDWRTTGWKKFLKRYRKLAHDFEDKKGPFSEEKAMA